MICKKSSVFHFRATLSSPRSYSALQVHEKYARLIARAQESARITVLRVQQTRSRSGSSSAEDGAAESADMMQAVVECRLIVENYHEVLPRRRGGSEVDAQHLFFLSLYMMLSLFSVVVYMVRVSPSG